MSERRPALARPDRGSTEVRPTALGRRRLWAAAVVLSGPLLVGALVHCVDDSFADGQFLCDPALPGEQCPPGQLCAADGRCRYSSLEPDAGADAGGDAGTDACVPRRCEDLLPACLPDASDECGHALDCTNACPGISTCGGGGVLGQCGCAPIEWLDGSPGRVYPIEYGQLDAEWEELEAGLTQDGVAAVTRDVPAGHDTDYLVFDQLGLDVPLGAQIRGIVVRVWRSTRPGTPTACTFRTQRIDLVWIDDAGLDASMRTPETDTWPLYAEGGDVERAYGAENQMWNVAWTPAQVNDPAFGIRVQAQCYGPNNHEEDHAYRGTARVDHANLTVYYEPACE